jgi:Right handed beta helix region
VIDRNRVSSMVVSAVCAITMVVTGCSTTAPLRTQGTAVSGATSVATPPLSSEAPLVEAAKKPGKPTKKRAPKVTSPVAKGLPGCTYIISPTGNDNGSGTVEAPWRTLDRAAGLLVAGDVLCARGGQYDGGPTLNVGLNGTAAKPITIKSAPGERAVFDGTTGPREFMVLGYRAPAANVIIENLTIQNWVKTESGTGAVYLSSKTSNITFRGNRFLTNGREGKRTDHDLYVSENSKNILIEDNYFQGAPGAAIHVWTNDNTRAVDGLTIRNNTIVVEPAGNWGILLSTDANNVLIERNLITGSAGCTENPKGCGLIHLFSGDGRYLPPHDAIIRSNVLVTTGPGPAINADSRVFNVLEENNLFWNTVSGSDGVRNVGADRLTSTRSRTEDPQFATGWPDAFTLRPTSPAIAMKAGLIVWAP